MVSIQIIPVLRPFPMLRHLIAAMVSVNIVFALPFSLWSPFSQSKADALFSFFQPYILHPHLQSLCYKDPLILDQYICDLGPQPSEASIYSMKKVWKNYGSKIEQWIQTEHGNNSFWFPLPATTNSTLVDKVSDVWGPGIVRTEVSVTCPMVAFGGGYFLVEREDTHTRDTKRVKLQVNC